MQGALSSIWLRRANSSLSHARTSTASRHSRGWCMFLSTTLFAPERTLPWLMRNCVGAEPACSGANAGSGSSPATLSLYLGNTALEPEINDAQLLATLPASPAATAKLTLHPAALEAGALLSQQQENERALGRSYVPVFTALGSVSGRGAGTALDGQFPGGTAGLAPDTFNWAARPASHVSSL